MYITGDKICLGFVFARISDLWLILYPRLSTDIFQKSTNSTIIILWLELYGVLFNHTQIWECWKFFIAYINLIFISPNHTAKMYLMY